MDPMEAFDVIMAYLTAVGPVKNAAPLYYALLRAADEMVAHSGYRDREEQIMTQRKKDVARLREIMAEVGL